MNRAFVVPILSLLVITAATIPPKLIAADDPPPLPREFRAAWVASVWNLHWPSRPGLSASQQQADLIRIFDTAKKLNLNAIILQVRPACDALYQSSLEPWSYYLTGKMGESPGYDPLEFAVTEAHARGLELHAWFNPFRASVTPNISPSSAHVTRSHPEAILSVYSYKWLDPGLEFSRNHALQVMIDVVRRYDVDGIHIDDYFYPYPKNPSTGPAPIKDSASYDAYRQSGGNLDLGDWRRHNIDSFVESLYRAIKNEKPWVKFGISPFGIYRPGVPQGIDAQLDSYNHIFADSRKWLHNGWCDYMSPQLYWPIDDKPHSFATLSQWWQNENKAGRHVWPGIASDRIAASPDYRPASESIRQIERSRDHDGTLGHVHWSIKPILENRKDLASLLTKEVYQSPALVPASPWLSSRPPAPPSVRIETSPNLTVHLPPSTSPAISFFAIQARVEASWRTAAIIGRSQSHFTFDTTPDAVAVTAVDRYGNTSPPTILTP